MWDKLLNEVNLFMAVPTVYAKLIEYYDQKYGTNRNNDRIVNYGSYIKHALTTKVRYRIKVYVFWSLPEYSDQLMKGGELGSRRGWCC